MLEFAGFAFAWVAWFISTFILAWMFRGFGSAIDDMQEQRALRKEMRDRRRAYQARQANQPKPMTEQREREIAAMLAAMPTPKFNLTFGNQRAADEWARKSREAVK